MDPLCHRGPRAWVAQSERVDFIGAQLVPSLAQARKGFNWTVGEARTQVFIGQDPTNHELNCLL